MTLAAIIFFHLVTVINYAYSTTMKTVFILKQCCFTFNVHCTILGKKMSCGSQHSMHVGFVHALPLILKKYQIHVTFFKTSGSTLFFFFERERLAHLALTTVMNIHNPYFWLMKKGNCPSCHVPRSQ